MEKMKNIDRFNLLTGLIFARLYETFPVSSSLFVEDLTKDYEAATGRKFVIDSKELQLLFSETMFWLRDGDYIAFSIPAKRERDSFGAPWVNEEGFGLITLSVKGLETLRKKPKSLNIRLSLGEQIANAVKVGAINQIGELVSATFAIGANLLIKWQGLD
jgi:hypothetical protein